METSSLLNIKSTMRQSSDVITGQALSMVSSGESRSDNFKSTFKNQLDKKSDAAQAKKDLPQSGKELPEKKVTAEKNDQTDAVKKEDGQNSRKLENNTDQANKTDIEEQKAVSQDDSSDSDNNNLQKNSQDEAQKDTQENENYADDNNSINENSQSEEPLSANLSEQFQASTTSENIDNHQTADALTADALTAEEQMARELAEKNISSQNSGVAVNSDELRLKVAAGQTDAVKVLHENNRLAALANAAATTSVTASETKNESALSKSIADFQQFIDMSKKLSTAGETIASVKNFEQGMKNELFNAQLLINDIKPAAAQNAQTTSIAGHTASLDRMNFQLPGQSSSLSQAMTSLEVKTPVGKSGWNQKFASQIMMMANNGVQQAKITLNPKHLGPVEAMVRLSGETAVVQLSSAHLSTKDAMESAIPRLKEMLNENGFSQVDVNVAHQDKQQQEAGLNAKNGSNNEHGNSTMPGDEQLSEQTSDSETETSVAASEQQGLNIVDYYA